MLNSIITQDQDGQNLFNAISSFFSTFGIGNLLRKCNAQKEKGTPVLDCLCLHKPGSFRRRNHPHLWEKMADITFGESFQIIITAMIGVCAIFQPTEEQLALFIDMFVDRLPDYIRNSLKKAALAS